MACQLAKANKYMIFYIEYTTIHNTNELNNSTQELHKYRYKVFTYKNTRITTVQTTYNIIFFLFYALTWTPFVTARINNCKLYTMQRTNIVFALHQSGSHSMKRIIFISYNSLHIQCRMPICGTDLIATSLVAVASTQRCFHLY